jgi:predicted PurR-regulated permease PerM
MKGWGKTLLLITGIIILLFLLWYFRTIVAYIIIAAVLSLVGRPVTDFLDRLGYKRFTMPRALAAALTLGLLWAAILLFFRIFVPVIVNQAKELSGLDYGALLSRLDKPIQRLQEYLQLLSVGQEQFSLKEFLLAKTNPLTSVSFLTVLFSSTVGFLGNVFVAFFSISFIAFFFMKDELLLKEAIRVMIPVQHEEAVLHALGSVKRLLMRYFVGLAIEVVGVIILVTTGMLIVGIKFQHAMVIGLFAGIMNIIPYLGPLIGSAFGLLLGLLTHLSSGSNLFGLLLLMLLVFTLVQFIDNWFFQPYIYSSSVQAHPLEVFIVILMAGSVGGITGMVVAIPAYTVLRVFAAEFLGNFRLVKKLTSKMKQGTS